MVWVQAAYAPAGFHSAGPARLARLKRADLDPPMSAQPMIVHTDSLNLTNGIGLDSGARLDPVSIAYATYGILNADRSNAILVCHALTGDQFAASPHPITGKPGWWQRVVGPGAVIDTDRFFVICANIIGGCMGSTGPASTPPGETQPWGLRFPVITIADMVRAQVHLIDHLGIDKLVSVVGGSMGGMQVLEWMTAYPDRLLSALPIATAARHAAQNIAFHEVGRQAIMSDPDWHSGAYAAHGTRPARGLALARMAAHITYMSGASLDRKFGRRLMDRAQPSFSFDADFQVESYLRYQGTSFVNRFDANSYLYITRAMDYFDIAARHGGHLDRAFSQLNIPVLLVSFTSDWLYPTPESVVIRDALDCAGVNVTHEEIESDKGHDAFLLEEPHMDGLIIDFLDETAKHHRIG